MPWVAKRVRKRRAPRLRVTMTACPNPPRHRIPTTHPDRIHKSRQRAGSLQDKLLGKPKSGCNVTPKDLQSLPCSPCLRYSTSEDGPDRTVYPKGRSAQLRFFRSLIGILCTLMIVLSRCFYGHLVFACGNETRHGRGNGSNGNRAGRCSRNRNPNSGIRGASRAKKEVKAPNGGHRDTQHKGGL